MYCRKCGFEIPDDSVFCAKCGTPVEGAAAHPQEPEPAVVTFNNSAAAPTPVKKKKKTGLLIACVAVALALVGAGVYFFVLRGAGSASVLPAIGTKQVSILEDKDKLAEITASVLKIECYDVTGELFATGSGFVAFDSDLIVTNYHVIEDHPAAIKALSESGSSFTIDKIVAYSEEMDIAILKTEAGTGLAPLTIAEKPTEKTDKVVAIGSPLGLMNIVSEGIVSGFTQLGNESVIQFTASISHGSSGGVLLNEAGEVVGVTFASYSEGQNLNMAIPVLYVDALYRQASPAKAVTVKQFFDAVEHVLPLSYILEHSDEYMGKYVTVQAYVSSSFFFFVNSNSYWFKDYAIVWLAKDKQAVLDHFETDVDILSDKSHDVWDRELEREYYGEVMRLMIKRKEADERLYPGSLITIRGKLTTAGKAYPDLYDLSHTELSLANVIISY